MTTWSPSCSHAGAAAVVPPLPSMTHLVGSLPDRGLQTQARVERDVLGSLLERRLVDTLVRVQAVADVPAAQASEEVHAVHVPARVPALAARASEVDRPAVARTQ